MEDELFLALYQLLQLEAKHRPRHKHVQFSDALILSVAAWAALHDRPICWACEARNWTGRWKDHWPDLPAASTMSQRLWTLPVQLLAEQLFYHTLMLHRLAAFCLARRMDSKPLVVGGFSKDRDARRGYAAAGICRGYKLFCCWGKSPTGPESFVVGSMNCSDQAGGMELIDQLQRLHEGAAGGYLLGDSTHDTNPLHAHAAAAGFQLLAPRKKPQAGLGSRRHAAARLRSIQMIEADSDPMSFGRQLYHQRGQIERDLGQLCSFGSGLAPLPAWVRRPHRVVRWVLLKLIINALRIQRKYGLTA